MVGAVYTTAVGGDRDALASLRPEMRGRVHSTFRSVINITTAQPELLSLTCSSVARAPLSIQLGLDRMDHHGIHVGDDVVSDGHTLRIGDTFVVIVAATPAWIGLVPDGTPVAARIDELDALLGTPRLHHGASGFERAVAERVGGAVMELRLAVLQDDEEAARHAATALVGLGVGLTPTGDDILTGAAFAATHLGAPLGLLHRAVAAAAESGVTNDISLTALRCALRGRAVQPLEDLYAWLCGADDNIHRLVADVLAIGHTSGADLALGLLTAVRLHQESQER